MIEQLNSKAKKICVVGMGYVGLPVALEFASKYCVVGFDINQSLIDNLIQSIDPRGEIDSSNFDGLDIAFTTDDSELVDIGVWVIAVPTPITKLKSPDLRPLLGASKTVGKRLEKGSIVIYESTVYPGCTEEDCLKVLNEATPLTYLDDYHIAYSPERINPGDKIHTLTNTVKIVSADSDDTLDQVAEIYNSIIEAGIHRAPSIKVAEAAKIVENTQRDLNIAFMNELSIIFDMMDIKTHDVLEAANTKWNFLNFYPGLVGGHCIGVDPYYLTYKSESLGYKPEIILAGRKVNDNLSKHVVKKVLTHLREHDISYDKARVLTLGITFKENVSDVRNSKVVDVVQELMHYNINVDIFDPHVNQIKLSEDYGLELVDKVSDNYDCIIAAVRHHEFLMYAQEDIVCLGSDQMLLVDIKNMYGDYKDLNVWSL